MGRGWGDWRPEHRVGEERVGEERVGEEGGQGETKKRGKRRREGRVRVRVE